MKIVYVYPKFTTLAGTERVLIDKMNSLANDNEYEVYVVTHEQSSHSFSYPLSQKVKHFDLDVCFYLLYRFNIIIRLLVREYYKRLLSNKFKELMSLINPDIVVTTTYHSYLVSMIGKCSNKFAKVVESHVDKRFIHSIDSGNYQSLSNRIHGDHDMRVLLKKVGLFNVLVALQKYDADDWSAYVHSCVIPNIVHLNPTGRITSLDSKQVIFVGRYTHQKGIPDLLKIWTIVHKKHPDWSLEMFGDGVLEDNLRYEANQIGVNVHKAVPNIFDYYLVSSVLVMTSVYEPFGLVIPEAMSCGLPVIAFDCPYGPRSIITDGLDGYLIEDRKIDAFAQKLSEMMESRELRRKLGQAAVLSSKRYSESQIMPLWKSLFNDLAKDNA